MKPRELSEAFTLFEAYKETLSKDPHLNSLFRAFLKYHQRTKEAFIKMGVFEYCKICGQGPKGGCCLREAGGWYDRYQLLINLMLAAKISTNEDLKSCPFLGGSGCTLVYRNEFCINFFCEDLKNTLGTQNIQYLRVLAGKEIYQGIKIEAYIRERLSNLIKKNGQP